MDSHIALAKWYHKEEVFPNIPHLSLLSPTASVIFKLGFQVLETPYEDIGEVLSEMVDVHCSLQDEETNSV